MRKRVITHEVVKLVSEQTRTGVAFSAVASMSGVARSTLQKWIDTGREIELRATAPENAEEQLYLDLARGYDVARAEVQKELVACIRLAARGRQGRADWRAAAFILERRYQDEWCRLVGEAKREAIDLILETLKDLIPEKDFEKLRRQLIGRIVEG